MTTIVAGLINRMKQCRRNRRSRRRCRRHMHVPPSADADATDNAATRKPHLRRACRFLFVGANHRHRIDETPGRSWRKAPHLRAGSADRRKCGSDGAAREQGQ
jgi:hypothetical protein